MKNIQIILALICSGFCTVPAFGQYFRDTIALNDPDRDFQIIWERGNYTRPESFGFFTSGEDIWQPVFLVDQNGRKFPTTQYTFRESDWYEQTYWRSFKVPKTTPYGKYNVTINNKSIQTLTVTGRKISQGSLGIFGKFSCLPDTTYRSYGTTIVGADIQLAPGVSLVGMTFYDSVIQGPFTNGLIKDCRFVRCSLGGQVDWNRPQEYADHGALYTDCLFDRSTCSGCCSGAFVNCKWTGRVAGVGSANGHAFVNERARRLCMINCTFDQTDRGPILRNNWGDNSDGLYVGLQFLNINSTTNGGELICAEGTDGSTARWDRNMLFGLRAYNCNHMVQLWNVQGDGNLIATSNFGPGSGVRFAGIRPQRFNEVRFCELSKPVEQNSNGTGAAYTKVLDNTVRP
jgi:hypothetical protein